MTDTVNSKRPANSTKLATPIAPVESPQAPLPKQPRRRWIWILAGTVAIAGIGTGVWYGLRPQTNSMIQLSGRIEGYETDVSTKGAGRVEEVTVREGAVVKKGQLLVRLSDAEVRSELQAAISQVNAAKQREASARLQIPATEAQIADGKLNLQQSEGDTQGKVTEGEGLVATAQAALEQEQARVGEAKALLEQARVDRDRYANLAAQGAETQQRYDLAKTAFNVAQAALQSRLAGVKVASRTIKIAQGKLTQAQTTSLNPGRQETSLSRLQTQLAQAQTALVATQADVKTAEANRQLIQSRLNNLTVNSPIDGVVTVRSVEPGTVVLPSRPLLRIVDLNQVYLRGFVPGAEIGRLQIGQSARVYLDNDLKHQSPLSATIAAIDSKASFTPENVYRTYALTE